MLVALENRLPHVAPDMKSQAVANTVWGFATLNWELGGATWQGVLMMSTRPTLNLLLLCLLLVFLLLLLLLLHLLLLLLLLLVPLFLVHRLLRLPVLCSSV
jgi:hypothetical protein